MLLESVPASTEENWVGQRQELNSNAITTKALGSPTGVTQPFQVVQIETRVPGLYRTTSTWYWIWAATGGRGGKLSKLGPGCPCHEGRGTGQDTAFIALSIIKHIHILEKYNKYP